MRFGRLGLPWQGWARDASMRLLLLAARLRIGNAGQNRLEAETPGQGGIGEVTVLF
jgi:hypothetical protein